MEMGWRQGSKPWGCCCCADLVIRDKSVLNQNLLAHSLWKKAIPGAFSHFSGFLPRPCTILEHLDLTQPPLDFFFSPFSSSFHFFAASSGLRCGLFLITQTSFFLLSIHYFHTKKKDISVCEQPGWQWFATECVKHLRNII